ncbi:MAG: hypothetical protein P1U77_06280 [Rubripirellula sp.]|nr:hypothetical protein [Planctomycetaceae bacterium]MDF1841025.1 hypothetical protein [Rubripirellula sp.]
MKGYDRKAGLGAVLAFGVASCLVWMQLLGMDAAISQLLASFLRKLVAEDNIKPASISQSNISGLGRRR